MNHYKLLLPPPATCPNDCIVGPTDISEVIVSSSSSSSSSSWGKRANSTRKRKHNNDNDNNAGTNYSNGNIDGGAANFAADTSHNSFQTAIQTFLSSGCCVIPGDGRRKRKRRRRSNDSSTTNNLLPDEELSLSCLPPEFVDICLHRAKTDYLYLDNLLKIEREKILTTNKSNSNHQQHQHHHKLTAITRQDYSELCARDGGRIDIRYKMKDYPYNCGGLIYNTFVYPLIQALLNGSSADNNDNDNDNDIENNNEPIQLVYAGVMWGMPIDIDNNNNNSSSSDDECCHHQKWHADGGHLFSQAQQDQLLPPGFTLPPHCINVFYPLVDLTQENGPTEFRIGSHRRDDNNLSKIAKDNKASKLVEFPLLCPAGGAVLFDYRIQHRGRANMSSSFPFSTATATTPSSTTTKLNTAEVVAEVIPEEGNIPPPTTSSSSSSPTTTTETTKAEMEVVNKGRPVLYLAYAKTWFKDHGNTRSGRRLCPKSSSSSSSSSNSASRTLTGQPVPYGKGFENYDTTSNSDNNINDVDCDGDSDGDSDGDVDGTDTNNENDGDTNISNGTTATATAAATDDDNDNDDDNHDDHDNNNRYGNDNNSNEDGEPWMLFQMTVELPNNTSEIIRVHKGDIAVEVSQQFCYKHSLSDDFISILTQTIQQQMNECCM
jgi:hypothetical protein